MLIECPECGRRVSDRAAACPDCGYPVAAELAAKREEERRAAIIRSRADAGREVDCVACEARGFVHSSEGFYWCTVCEHTGRVQLCKADDGFYAVARALVAVFVRGEVHPGETGVGFLGADAPLEHKYPEAGERVAEGKEEEEKKD